MSFHDTYAEEVLQSRRARAQRAGFWAKVVSFMLMITIAATLRSEPELRRALMTAGTDAVMQVTGRSAPAPAQPTVNPMDSGMARFDELLGDLPIQMGQMARPNAVQTADDTPSGVKINRPGTHNGPRFLRVGTGDTAANQEAGAPDPALNMQSVMEEVGRLAGQAGTLD